MRCYGLFGLLEIPKSHRQGYQGAGEKGMNVDDHFNQAVDMVRIGSGSFRKVNIFRLSRMACMIVAENADAQKVLVQQARDYFTRTIRQTN